MTPEDLPGQAVDGLPDVVFAGEPETMKSGRGPDIILDLLLELGDKVRFSAFGLDAGLAGQTTQ